MATTIRLTDDTRDLLDEEKVGNESFDDTVRRLLGESDGQLWTEQDIKNMVDARISERVVPEAQR